MTLKQLAVEHPYYCSLVNYFSNETSREWSCVSEFLDEFEDADINMNMVFRWDILLKDEDHPEGGYKAHIFLMGQRKGLFFTAEILHIDELEVERLLKYLMRHWEHIQELWRPISNPGG